MSGDVQIELWMNEMKVKALSAVLALRGTTVEREMQARLDALYCEMVPAEKRREIQGRLDTEKLQAAADREAARTFAAFHITERGDERWLRQEGGTEFLQAAILLRKYLTGEYGEASSFSKALADTELISEQEFRDMAMERMENTGRVAGAFEMDLDAGTFSALHIMDGWRSYNIRDVSTAAFRATQKSYAPMSERWSVFLSRLDGRELTDVPRPVEACGSRRLMAADVMFSDEIMEIDHWLNFYLANVFDVDEVFGTHVETDVNGNWLNVYAYYDLESGEIADTLELTLCRDDGEDVQMVYHLNDEERAMLLGKMDIFCQQDSGRSLAEWREEYFEKQQPSQEMRM